MAKLTKAKGKIVRRLGVNIFGHPKYDRLLKRKPNPPGELRNTRVRITEFGRQLIEKQKLKFSYGVSEKQLRGIFSRAQTLVGVTGHNMVSLLERRIDNVIYRAGFASSRLQARQMVSHGHVIHNGKRITIPSIRVRVNDMITIKSKESTITFVRKQIADSQGRAKPDWLSVDDLSIKITMLPTREMVPLPVEEQLVVEFYSK